MAHPPRPPLPPELPRVIGHRGAAASAPENTLASFREAARQGARWVECDLRLTADGVPVLLHDADLNRTTDRSGPLRSLRFAELQGADAGSWFAPAFVGESLPDLEAAVGLATELGLGLNLELKAEEGGAEALVAGVAAVLERAPHPALLLSSFEEQALRAAAELLPQLPRGLLVEGHAATTAARATALGCASVHLAARGLKTDAVTELGAAGFAVLAYTVNDSEQARRLFAQGVRAVFTDAPAALLARLGSTP